VRGVREPDCVASELSDSVRVSVAVMDVVKEYVVVIVLLMSLETVSVLVTVTDIPLEMVSVPLVTERVNSSETVMVGLSDSVTFVV
jgi:hypothetical protein